MWCFSRKGTGGELLSFLVRITIDIFGIKDDKGMQRLPVRMVLFSVAVCKRNPRRKQKPLCRK